MKQSDILVPRSIPMLIACYYLSRCGEPVVNRPTNPPAAIGAKTWKEAFDFFFDAMGDGRTLVRFRNSMSNARDTFDIIFDNGREGWKDAGGLQPSLRGKFLNTHEQWKDQSDEALESFVLGLRAGIHTSDHEKPEASDVRTEGGEKCLLQSVASGTPVLEQVQLQFMVSIAWAAASTSKTSMVRSVMASLRFIMLCHSPLFLVSEKPIP